MLYEVWNAAAVTVLTLLIVGGLFTMAALGVLLNLTMIYEILKHFLPNQAKWWFANPIPAACVSLGLLPLFLFILPTYLILKKGNV